MQIERLQKLDKLDLSAIPLLGEQVIIEPIGNHSRGSMFADFNTLKSEIITRFFQTLTEQIEDLNFARYDLKVMSDSDLSTGENLKILEINGVGGRTCTYLRS